MHLMRFLALTCISILGKSIAEYIYVVQGKTGAGKSSVINMMNNGNIIAEEGMTYDSETNTTEIYDTLYPNIKLIDTPGVFDTLGGYTNAEINTLIRSTLISKSTYSVSGVLLIFDPTEIKLHIQTMIEAVLSMYHTNMLKNTFIVFNKNDKINDNVRKKAINYATDKLLPIYKNYNINYDSAQIRKRILFLDTKGDINLYSNKLKDVILNGPKDQIQVLSNKVIKSKIDKYYQKELKDESNYEYKIDEIIHSEKRTRKVPKDKVEPYTVQNCRKKCRTRVLGVCVNRKRVCQDSVQYRTVQIMVDEEYIHTWTGKKQRKELKNNKEYLWNKAKHKMVNEMKNKVYTAFQTRSRAKSNNHQEL